MSATTNSPGPLSNWYFIRCDKEKLVLDVRTEDPWTAEIPWDQIERVCMVPGDMWSSDELYVFVKGRKNSYVIPLEANGGADLMGTMPESVLPFSIRIGYIQGEPGDQFWWPPLDD